MVERSAISAKVFRPGNPYRRELHCLRDDALNFAQQRQLPGKWPNFWFREFDPLYSGWYRGVVLVEVRKQTVAGPVFRGASGVRVKGAAGSSAEVAEGSFAEAPGGRG